MNKWLDASPALKNELAAIVLKIRETLDVDRIILFGSYAAGQPGPDSDIDLCVLTKDPRRKIELLRLIRSSIGNTVSRPIDLIIERPEEFADRMNSIATLEKTIAQNGVELYGKIA